MNQLNVTSSIHISIYDTLTSVDPLRVCIEIWLEPMRLCKLALPSPYGCVLRFVEIVRRMTK